MRNTIHPKVGQRFGQLTVIEVPDKYNGQTFIKCQCDCDNQTIRLVRLGQLRRDRVISCHECGKKRYVAATIKRSTKHNMCGTRLHNEWCGIRQRCNNKRNDYYGKRGIKVCDEWSDFTKFMEWALANGYADDLEIDRKDPNGDYCPENCKWSTRYEQMNNLRRNILLTAFGETKTITQWCNDPRCKVSRCSLYMRIRRNWSHLEAITVPTLNNKTRVGFTVPYK